MSSMMPLDNDDDNNNNHVPSSTSSAAAVIVEERDREIARLRAQVTSLTNQLESARQQQQAVSRNGRPNQNTVKRRPQMSPHAIHIQQVDASAAGGGGGSSGGGDKRHVIRAGRERMGRNASISTQQVMANLPSTDSYFANHPLALRILDMFQRPAAHIDYLNSEQFAKDLFKLCQKVRTVLEREPRVVYLQSPCYIFGDIHGNLEDLHFFSDNIWRLGMGLTAGNFLFLGDYVDRGMSCLEVTAYLLAMKLQLPHKVYLLRGNHETRDVNGWEEHYGERSFIWQCRQRFGDDIGYRVWEACNQVFDRLPLSAVVDQDIFCVHGGIPRPIASDTTRIQDILNVPKVAGINPPYEHEDDAYQQVASDCIWSDPASEEQELHSVDPMTGYGESLRGGGAICFGNKAVTDFLQQQNFSYIMRAHEAHAEGVAVSKGARVFTVFSTSKDHNQGSQALAGCILVDDEKLQVINRSPAYRNQYVHRRDSVSLQSLSPAEIAKRIRLGLVTRNDGDDSDDDRDEEEWDDFDSDEEQEEEQQQQRRMDGTVGGRGRGGSIDDDGSGGGTNGQQHDQRHHHHQQQQQQEPYTFAQGRRSSINLQQMSQNIHDSQTIVDSEAGSCGSFRSFSAVGGASMDIMALMGNMSGSSSLIREVVREDMGDDDDDETSTVDGNEISDREMEK